MKYLKLVKHIGSFLIKCVSKLLINVLKIITFLVFLMLFLAPALFSGLVSFIPNFDYEKYIKTLEVILNGSWMYVIGIIFCLLLFKKEISTKLTQLVKVQGVEFDRQSDKEEIAKKSGDVIMSEEERENVDSKAREFFNKHSQRINNQKNGEDNQAKAENVKVQELSNGNIIKYKDRITEEYKRKYDLEKIKNSLFQMRLIEKDMAKDTKLVLKLIYYRNIPNINYEEMKKLVKSLAPVCSTTRLKNQVDAIIYYLINNGILETEDDDKYELTLFGRRFLRFIFEREVDKNE